MPAGSSARGVIINLHVYNCSCCVHTKSGLITGISRRKYATWAGCSMHAHRHITVNKECKHLHAQMSRCHIHDWWLPQCQYLWCLYGQIKHTCTCSWSWSIYQNHVFFVEPCFLCQFLIFFDPLNFLDPAFRVNIYQISRGIWFLAGGVCHTSLWICMVPSHFLCGNKWYIWNGNWPNDV